MVTLRRGLLTLDMRVYETTLFNSESLRSLTTLLTLSLASITTSKQLSKTSSHLDIPYRHIKECRLLHPSSKAI